MHARRTLHTPGPIRYRDPLVRLKLGVRPAEIEKLFHDEAEKGEGIVTVPIGLERLDEDGLLEQSD